MPRPKKTPELATELAKDWSYEMTLSDIETIVAQLETGELPLSDVFDQFEQAVNKLQQCDHFLKAKQQQATLLIETLAEEED
jgi:exodeoxyribonuclease VII small subunit